MLRSLLFYRIVLFNACVGALATWAYAEGWLKKLFAVETTGIGYGLVALTVLAVLGTLHRAAKVSTAFNSVKAGTWVDTRKLLTKSSYIGQIATCLMLVGLFGNSLGIFISFLVVDFTSTDTILTSVGSMYGGLKIAFANSLISIALYVVVRVNFHILTVATRLLVLDAKELRK